MKFDQINLNKTDGIGGDSTRKPFRSKYGKWVILIM